MNPLNEQMVEAPEWATSIEFCHILLDSHDHHYCGNDTDIGAPRCQDYDGEAICPTCGNPTCPRCAQLEALDSSLEDVA